MSTIVNPICDRFILPKECEEILTSAKSVLIPNDREELVTLAMGGKDNKEFEVVYDAPGRGEVVEAKVVRCKNGLAVNYIEPHMRRRDPDCMLVADNEPTDKETFETRFSQPFTSLRDSVFGWLKEQDLIVLPFYAGGPNLNYPSLLIAPKNAGFFAAALADLQGMIPMDKLPVNAKPCSIIYLAPPFRHTFCGGRQVVVHNRTEACHEVFSLNLYPGPSAKKGVYGVLLNVGEDEGWTTLHGSTVQVVTPYDNVVTIMHEGASGGGKSEMLEYPHREADGRLLLGRNVVHGEERHLALNQSCRLRPITDDMAIATNLMQDGSKKLTISDAEDSWFVRVNHIEHYGIDPHLEHLTIHPPEPLIFLNIQGTADSTCLIWEHTEDEPGQRCPNPRVVMPRRIVPGIVDGQVEVDVRSFGVRTPPCTAEAPNYGIAGFLHLLPPSLAWLWRMVSPRGHANPSITDTEGMTSEGVGSYWPFATGRRVDQANILLQQILNTPSTRFALIPNQHVGAWEVGFMPQWIARDYLARRGGAKFSKDQLVEARCPLLGYALKSMQVEGTLITRWFLEVNRQPEVGNEGYDAGAAILQDFFRKELQPFLKEDDLDPLGRKIIEACLDQGGLSAFEELIPVG